MNTGTLTDVSHALAPCRAGRREWMGLCVLALPCLLYSMDVTVMNLAVPALSADLKPTAAQLLWMLDIYGFVVSGLLITMGTLGDRIGRRRLLLLGAGAFGVASVCAAFSTSAAMLIAMRATLGIAGATLAPATLSLIRTMFADSHERATAISVWVSSYSVGSAIGPVIGGALLQHYWWGSVFLIGVPVMALLIVLGPVLLPEYRDPNAGRIDWLSSALSLAAVLTTLYGVKQLAGRGFATWPMLCIAVGSLIGWLFYGRQKYLAVPMIDLTLLRRSFVPTALTVYALASFVCVGSFVLVSQYLQLILELQPLEAGLWTLPIPIIFVIGAIITPALTRQMGSVPVMAAGLGLAATGFVMLSLIGVATPARVAIALCTYAAGLSPVFPIAIELAVSGAPPKQAGAVSAISETVGEFGAALGIALLGSVSTAIYRIGIGGLMLTAQSGGVEISTLGGAVEMARRIGGAFGAEVLAASRAAFMQGLRGAALVSAVCLLLAALWVTHLRRNHVH